MAVAGPAMAAVTAAAVVGTGVMLALIEALELKGVGLAAAQRQGKAPHGHVNGVAERGDALDAQRGAPGQSHRQQFRSVRSVCISNAGDAGSAADRQISQTNL
jgi:hypothetical protein